MKRRFRCNYRAGRLVRRGGAEDRVANLRRPLQTVQGDISPAPIRLTSTTWARCEPPYRFHTHQQLRRTGPGLLPEQAVVFAHHDANRARVAERRGQRNLAGSPPQLLLIFLPHLRRRGGDTNPNRRRCRFGPSVRRTPSPLAGGGTLPCRSQAKGLGVSGALSPLGRSRRQGSTSRSVFGFSRERRQLQRLGIRATSRCRQELHHEDFLSRALGPLCPSRPTLGFVRRSGGAGGTRGYSELGQHASVESRRYSSSRRP